MRIFSITKRVTNVNLRNKLSRAQKYNIIKDRNVK